MISIARPGLGVLALALIVGAGWWLVRSPAPSPQPLVLAVAQTTFGAPLWVAQGRGFFAAAGLAVTLRPYATGKLALEAMLRGEADVATVTEAPLVFASLAGARFAVIANYAASTEHSLVARADRGIAALSDLRGRRVGVVPGTSAQYFLHVLLTDEGMSEADISVVPLSAPAQAAALGAGDVDAVSAFAPYSGQCRLALGDGARSFGTGIRYTGYGNLVAAYDLPSQRPEAMLRLLRAMERTIHWMRNHREESQALAAAGAGTPLALLRDGWDTLNPNLGLDQGFVVLLQTEARWAIAAGLVPGWAAGTAVPDYRDFINAAALTQLRPELVTMIGKL